MTYPITLKHIAEQVNKTVVTVSKALRDHPDISKETSDEINITGAKNINIESESDINIKSSGTVDINNGNLTIES